MKKSAKKPRSASQRLGWGALFIVTMIAASVLFAGSALPTSSRADDAAPAHPPIVVAIAGMTFSPARLHAHMGETIEFQNKDIVPHTATSKQPDGFDSGMIMPGKTWSTVLSKAGTFHFACQFHPDMVGEVVVEK